MPKALPPAFGPLKFHGRMDWPPEDRIDDWGLTPSQQESYVEQFRRVLLGKNAYREVDHDYYLLRRFLRARTYDIERATQMWLDSQRWREEFKVDTILQDFYFEEREAFLKTYPQGYHKTDKMGRPVYVQEIGKINLPELKKATTEERMIKFHIQEYERCCKVILPICSELAKKNIDTTFGIMDVKGVGLGHLTGEVKRIMSVITKYDQDNYPEMLGHICIINAPAVFRMLWSVVKGMLDVRTQSKIEILGPNYTDTLLQWVDADNLPKWLGGKSEGTLYDDVGPWSDMALVTSLGLSIEDLKAGRKPRMVFTSPTMQRSLTYRGPGSGASVIATRVKSDATKALDGAEPEFARLSSGRATEALDLAGIKSINYTAQLATVAERPRTLVERVAALEALLPGQLERLKNDMRSDEAKEKMSTRSAPEGTLLHRIEVLEDAMDTLLAAEAAQLETVQAMQAVQQVKDAPHVRQGCGCVVM